MAVRHDKCRAPSLFLLLSTCRSLAICHGDMQRTGSDRHPTLASNQRDRMTGVHHGTEFADAR